MGGDRDGERMKKRMKRTPTPRVQLVSECASDQKVFSDTRERFLVNVRRITGANPGAFTVVSGTASAVLLTTPIEVLRIANWAVLSAPVQVAPRYVSRVPVPIDKVFSSGSKGV